MSHCSVQTDTWCVPAVCHTCWPMHVSRTRWRPVQAAAVRSVVRCAVVTWQLRRQSRSCRHHASSVHEHCRARCYRDTSQRCASTGSFGITLPTHCCYYQCRCSRVIRCLIVTLCDGVDHVGSSNVTYADVFAVWMLWSSLLVHVISDVLPLHRRPLINVPEVRHLPTSSLMHQHLVDNGQCLTVNCHVCFCCVCLSVCRTERSCRQWSRDDWS